MDLFVDDRPVGEEFVEHGITVEDALRHVQSSLCDADRLVMGLRCDGRDVPANAMAETLRKPADSFERLDILTGTRDMLVTDAMAQASACLIESESACTRAAELLTEGNTVDAARTLADCLRVWQQIHDAVGKSIEMLELDPERATVDGVSLMELIGRPKEVLMQVKDALQIQDYVLLADILRYEFSDVTEVWHEVIARVRQEAAALGATHGP